MIGYLLVAAGAAVGAPLRYLTDRVVQSRTPNTAFPFGTLTVNIVGSLLLGAVVAATLAHAAPTDLQILVGTGFCGALTTYSTFSYETVRLLQEKSGPAAAWNAAATLAAGIGAAAAGFALITALAR